MKAPDNLRDFRDPKVFWFDSGADGSAGHWVMLLAGGNRILFYTSPDLKTWTASGAFGPGYGSTAGVWETPELVHLTVDSGPTARWVLLVGLWNGAPAGGSGIQYFVGQFDGRKFTSDTLPTTVLWADYGADFYAAQAWNDAPGGRHILAAWMNNWSYANRVPTTPWRGALTLPRELALANTPQGLRLVQQPVPELRRLRGEGWRWQNITLPAAGLLIEVQGDALEIVAEFQVDAATAAQLFGFRVRIGDGEQTAIGYAMQAKCLFVDRTQSGSVDFGPGFGAVHTAPLPPVGGAVRLHVFVDRASVEVFGNDGLVVLTDQIFPAATSLGVEAFADGGPVTLRSLNIYQLAAAKFQAYPAEPVDARQSTPIP